MYSQKFAKEDTKSRKDSPYCEVTLSLISEKKIRKPSVVTQGFNQWRKNFYEERAKSKKNLDEVKALVEHQTHKVHKQYILLRGAVLKEVENRKEVLQTVHDINKWVDEMALELKVSFIFILLHDLYHLQ